MTSEPTFTESMIVESLGPKHIRAVYPLIQLADPAISLPHWLRYASGLSSHPSARRGVLTCMRPSQLYPSGAVCYRSERTIQGNVLVAENFVALDILHPEAIMASLLRGLDSVAAALGCHAIRAMMRGTSSPMITALRKAGHYPQGVTMTKSLNRRVGRAH